VLFVDPPYFGKENYYSYPFGRADHVWLADQLQTVAAAVVCSYYDDPMIRALYPEPAWQWNPLQNRKNSQRRGSQKENATDWILIRKGKSKTDSLKTAGKRTTNLQVNLF
jgi:site-specific DNA-adenine methylase